LKETEVLPSRYKIAKYWFNLKKNNNPIYIKSTTDLGEPQCFACGFYNPRWERKVIEEWEQKNKKEFSGWHEDDPKFESWMEKIWSNTKLERAHIIASSVEGDCSVDNLVLLCSGCHLNAPMTNNPQYMYDYINNKPYFTSSNLEQFQKDLNASPYGESIIEKLTKLKTEEEEQEIVNKFIEKFNELQVGNHFSHVSNFSLICALNEL